MQLCFDLIEEWIKNNPKASICTPEGVHKFRDIANFQDYHRLPDFRSVGIMIKHVVLVIYNKEINVSFFNLICFFRLWQILCQKREVAGSDLIQTA